MPSDLIEEVWETAVEAAWREIAKGTRKRTTRRTRRKTKREQLLEKIEKMLRDDDFNEPIRKSKTHKTRTKRSTASRSTYHQRKSRKKTR